MACFMVLGGAQVLLQRSLDTRRVTEATVHPSVPSFPAALAQAGFRRRPAADLQWIRICSYAGDAAFDATGRPALEPLIRLTIALDPTFRPAYELGGLMLSADRHQPERSVPILLEGESHFPESWNLPFMAGALQLFLLGDTQAAASTWLRAAQKPGAPTYLQQLAVSTLATGGDCPRTLELVRGLIMDSQGPLRTSLMAREQHLRLECALQNMEGAVERYSETRGSPPASLDALVQAGLLPAIPEHPYQGHFSLRPDGSVDSGVAVRRLRLRGRADELLRSPKEAPHGQP